jgi:hypothetical protein
MSSKWQGLKEKLKPFQIDSERQKKIDEAKSAYIALSPTELARAFKMKRDVKDELKKQDHENNIEIDAISQLLVSALESSDVQLIKLESGMSCGLETQPNIKIIDAAQYGKWSHSTKIKPLLTLNAKVRDAFVKEEVMKLNERGKPLPTWLTAWAEVTYWTRAHLYGRKKENSQNGGNDEE